MMVFAQLFSNGAPGDFPTKNKVVSHKIWGRNGKKFFKKKFSKKIFYPKNMFFH